MNYVSSAALSYSLVAVNAMLREWYSDIDSGKVVGEERADLEDASVSLWLALEELKKTYNSLHVANATQYPDDAQTLLMRSGGEAGQRKTTSG